MSVSGTVQSQRSDYVDAAGGGIPENIIDTSRYRPSLDGIRALAVVGVILYHFGYPWMRGGFLGVDVFFVLSGYLITSILLSDLRSQKFDLASFWVRRARRLLPALLVMCVAVAIVVRVADPVSNWPPLQSDLWWTIFYGANWHFIASDQDYFAQWFNASPLRHTWSLAIEEQFYLAWPLVLVLLARFARGSRLILAGAVGVGILASVLAMLVVFDPWGPSRAYYGTDSRAHELLIGALLGIATTGNPALTRDRGKVVDLVAALGLLGVVGAFLIVPDSWPGYYRGGSLVLSITVGCVLWAVESRPTGLVSRVLSIGGAQWLGRISYGLYLWHWPVIVFAGPALAVFLASLMPGLIGGTTGLNAVRAGIILALAVTSYYVLERPIRRGYIWHLKLTNRRVLVAAAVAMLGAASTSVLLTTVSPGIANGFEPGEYTTCPGGGDDLTCVRHIASSSKRPLVAVVGDSTARSLDAGLIALSQANDWTYIAAAQNGCTFLDRLVLSGPNQVLIGQARCPHDNAVIRQRLLDVYQPDLIIVMDRFFMLDSLDASGNRLVAGTPAHLQDTEQRLELVASDLTSRGAKMVCIDALPMQVPLDCATRPQSPACEVFASSDRLTATYNAIIHSVVARHPENMRAISLTNTVCPDDHCVPSVDGTIMRYDGIHFTKAAALWLAPSLYGQLENVGLVPVAVTHSGRRIAR